MVVLRLLPILITVISILNIKPHLNSSLSTDQDLLLDQVRPLLLRRTAGMLVLDPLPSLHLLLRLEVEEEVLQSVLHREAEGEEVLTVDFQWLQVPT